MTLSEPIQGPTVPKLADFPPPLPNHVQFGLNCPMAILWTRERGGRLAYCDPFQPPVNSGQSRSGVGVRIAHSDRTKSLDKSTNNTAAINVAYAISVDIAADVLRISVGQFQIDGCLT